MQFKETVLTVMHLWFKTIFAIIAVKQFPPSESWSIGVITELR